MKMLTPKRAKKAQAMLFSMALFTISTLLVGIFSLSPAQKVYAAALTPTSVDYLDTGTPDGQVDVIRLTFTNVTACAFEPDDWSVGADGAIGVASVDGIANTGTCTTDNFIDVQVTASAGVTGGVTDPRIDYNNTDADNSVVADTNQDAANFTASDGAAPFLISATYSDTGGAAGTVDQVAFLFSEVTTFTTITAADWLFSNGDINLANDFVIGDCTGSGTLSTITCTDTDNSSITADANKTGKQTSGGAEPVFTYTNNTNDINDGTNNTGGFVLTLSDGATPLVIAAITQDTDANGKLDHIELEFTEILLDTGIQGYQASSNWTPSTLDIDIVSGDAVEATEGTCANDAAENDKFLCLIFNEDAGTCSALDRTGCDTELVNQDVTWTGTSTTIGDASGNFAVLASGGVTEADGAAPIALSARYEDIQGPDGTVDRVRVFMSEPGLSCAFEAGDWTFPTPGDINVSTPTACATTTESILITVAADANETGGTVQPTIQYANQGTPDQFTDTAGNPVSNFSPITTTDATAPFLTDVNITVTKTENAGSATVGNPTDVITVVWDAVTDGDVDIATVYADFVDFGGGQVLMEDDGADGNCDDTAADDNIWCATYTLVAGSIDDTDNDVTLTSPFDSSGNIGFDETDGTQFSIDTQLPIVTTACISVTGATGNGGAFINANTPVSTWNNNNPGGGCTDNNADISTVSFDSSDFRTGDTALTGADTASVWTASLSGAMDSQEDANNNTNTTVTVTDDAGNVVVTAGTNNYDVDTVLPSFVSATTLDNNNDGIVDFIKVVYSEAVVDSTVSAADFEAGIADTGASNLTEVFTSTIPSSGNETDNANDATIYIGVASSGESISANKTDYQLKIEQVAGVSDSAGNILASFALQTSSDGASPIFLSASTLDNNNDGIVDFIKVVYSEAVDDFTVSVADFEAGIADTTGVNLTESFTSLTPNSGNETDSANDATIYIGVASSGETISANKTDYLLKIEQVGGVDDANTNTLASFVLQTSSDAAAPAFVSAKATSDTNIEITMSETVDTVNFGAAGDWTATNMTSTGVAISGDPTKLDLTVSSLSDTAFTASDFAFSTASGSFIRDAVPNSTTPFSSKNIDDGQAPTISAGNLAIDDSGCSGVCEVGETMIFTWNNSADGNTDLNDATVQADLTNFGGSATQQLFDDASNGDSTAGDEIFTFSYTVVTDNDDGTFAFTVSATDTSTNATGPIASTDTATVYNIATGALGSTNVEPADLSAGAIPTVTVDFTTIVSVPADGKIVITFPSGFDVSGASSGTCAGTMDGNYTTSVAGQEVTITRNSGTSQSAAAETCTLAGIRNPQVSGTTGTYQIKTTTSGDATIDQDTAVTADTITAGLMSSAGIVLTDADTGATDSVTINFTTTNPVPADGKVVVIFPASFDISAASGGTCSSMLGTFTTGVAGQNLTLTRIGGSPAIAAAHTCTVNNITNPSTTGVTGTFTISTTTNGDVEIDTDIGVAGVTIDPSVLTNANVQPVALTAGAVGQTTVSFTTQNSLPADGKIKVTFPAGFDVSGAASGICSTMDGTFVTSINSQEVILTRQNDGAPEPAGPQTCTINSIKNPAISGSTGIYTILTTDSADISIELDAAVAADTILPGVLTSANVQPASLSTSANSIATATFTNANGLPNNGKIKVVFGSGFDLTSVVQGVDADGSCSGGIDGSLETFVNGQEVTLVRLGGTTATPGAQSCSIANVVNSGTPGSTGTYSITTTSSSDVIIDQDSSVNADIIAGLRNTSISLTNTIVNQGTSLTFSMLLANALPADGKIQIVVPTSILLPGVSGQTTTSNVGIGALTASQSGQTITFTGSAAAANATITFTVIGGLNGPTLGDSGTFTFRTQTAADVTIDEDTAVSGVTLTAVPVVITPTTTTTISSGGGGGGGSISTRSIPSDSNTVTSALSSSITKTVNTDKEYSRSLKLSSSIIRNDAETEMKTAQLTGDSGTIMLKPNKDSTISAFFPEDTMITTTQEWDGVINPPLEQSVTKVSKLGGVIKGSNAKLLRDNVARVIKVGSTKAVLSFSKDITLQIPVDLADGTTVTIYRSPLAKTWEVIGDGIVIDGKVIFDTNEFSFFALEIGAKFRESAPISRFVALTTFNDIRGHWGESYINDIAARGFVSGKRPGVYAPNDFITRAELTKIAVNAFGLEIPSSVTLKPFMDVDPGAWYAPYIKAAKDAGVVRGIGVDFKPNEPISRVATLKILIEAADFKDVFENYDANYSGKTGWSYVFFPDVMIGQWYARYIAYAKDFGIVSGYSDGLFHPGDPVTRAEVAKMVIKVLELLE